MSDAPLVLSQRDERGMTTLTLNRPQAFNSLSEGLLEALQTALDRVAADERARVVVVAGAGKAFCAGHDLKEMRANPDGAFHAALMDECVALMLAIVRCPKPVMRRCMRSPPPLAASWWRAATSQWQPRARASRPRA